MKLHMLGTAGYHRNEYRETSCAMIPELGIVLDAGSGFSRVRKLLKQVPQGVPLQVLLSHGHIDHTLGLTFGINTRYGNDIPIKVFGHGDHLSAMEHTLFGSALFPLEIDHPLLGIQRESWREFLPSDGWNANGVPMKVQSLPHPGGSVGYRLALPTGRDLVYITDTCADDVPVEFVEGADTLIHECNFTDNLLDLALRSGHSTTSQVLRLAKRAGVKKLVLTHWNTLLELEADMPIDDMTGRDLSEKLPFELVLAKDGMEIEI